MKRIIIGLVTGLTLSMTFAASASAAAPPNSIWVTRGSPPMFNVGETDGVVPPEVHIFLPSGDVITPGQP